MSKVAIQGAATGTGVFTLASPATNTDRTLTLPDEAGTVLTSASTGGVSQAMLASGVVGAGPAFSAYKSGSATLTSLSNTVVPYNAEYFDTDSWFDTSTYRYTPQVAGYYQVNFSASISDAGATGIIYTFLRKNGTDVSSGSSGYYENQRGYGATAGSVLVELNGSTDYLDVTAIQYTGGGNRAFGTCTFSGFLVRKT
jgi:hypothetical protein